MRGRGDRMLEVWRRSERHGDGFVWLGGDAAYQVAPKVISQSSWWL